MEKNLKDLQFVQVKGEGLEGFGIIACKETSEEPAFCLMLGDMDEDFGTCTISVSEIETVDEDTIKKNLAEISKDKEKFAYFIIQLNDIPELKEYHIEEDNFLKDIRKTNEVCLYCKENNQ